MFRNVAGMFVACESARLSKCELFQVVVIRDRIQGASEAAAVAGDATSKLAITYKFADDLTTTFMAESSV